MPIDRDSVTPLWVQVEADLRRRLANGEFSERFPTDRELVQQYDVSRHTAREAVRRLRADGVLTRARGRGSFVNPDALEQPLGALYSLFRSVEAQGLSQRSIVRALELVTDAEAAARLGEPAQSDLVFLSRLRLAGEEPLAVDRVWLPASIATPLLEADFSRTALYDELRERCGTVPTGGSERIEPTLPSATDAAELGVRGTTPAMSVTRIGRTPERVIEYRRTIIRGDRYAFVADWGDAGNQALRATTSTSET
ncbi:GntR family transcriptional regulator [Egibacter rhizosphaerae]|uniref:GntR family transcriptional regulator n=2 Tax=Egibacter rhizosphaerae TaxID=1670831 RepID=A0A411YLL0_9ACTN|nr:GntR family transcriptional regulator [Egibacter rhizosphaerae]